MGCCGRKCAKNILLVGNLLFLVSALLQQFQPLFVSLLVCLPY